MAAAAVPLLRCQAAGCAAPAHAHCPVAHCGLRYCAAHAAQLLFRCEDTRGCGRFFCCKAHADFNVHAAVNMAPVPGGGVLCFDNCGQVLCAAHQADRQVRLCSDCGHATCHSDHLPEECGSLCARCRQPLCFECVMFDSGLCRECYEDDEQEDDDMPGDQ